MNFRCISGHANSRVVKQKQVDDLANGAFILRMSLKKKLKRKTLNG